MNNCERTSIMNLEFLIKRTIYENKKVSQRDLSKQFFVSLGKINSIMKELESKGDIIINNKSNNYELSETAIVDLKKHKVDAAIILACGIGVRLAPLTYDTPKSFIKIKGERMIERQIKQLKAAGIDDITIMVGFMKEKFDYLIDKFNVRLVYNREYKYKNTLSTFYHARDLMRGKNVYICVSDVYISENIYHEYECEPYYIGAFYEDCKNEWRYVTNSKNEIKGVILGGKNDFCLVGPAFLTKEFLDKFIPMIETYYNESSTDNFYWEDVLVRNFKNLPTIYLYKLGEKSIFEFDTLEDLKRFDKENTEFGSEAISFVSRAFNIKDNEIENIEIIKEGMTNHSYKFTYKGVKYLARVPGNDTESFINRKVEYEIFEKLKDKNITEEIIYFDKEKGYKISKYFENSSTIDINNDEELKNCFMLYKKLHSYDIEVSGCADIMRGVKTYIDIINNRNIVVPYEDFDEVVNRAYEIEKEISKYNRKRVLCHGDPNPYNILKTNAGYKIIDFEYGGMADPLSDIALFGAYVGFDLEKTFALYEVYKNCDVSKEIKVSDNAISNAKISDNDARKLIKYYMAIGGLFNAVWAMVLSFMTNADYGTFGMDGYRTFKNMCKAS